MSSNPYQAPVAAFDPVPPVKLEIEAASRIRRFFNWLIDKLAIYGLLFASVLLAMAVGGPGVMAWLEGINRWQDFLITSGLMLVYYIVMEGLFGLTLGKLVTNTRVVDEYGNPPGLRKAMLRTFSRFIPFEAFSLFFGGEEKRRAWHDSLPGTYVVARAKPGQRVGRPVASIADEYAAAFRPAAIDERAVD